MNLQRLSPHPRPEPRCHRPCQKQQRVRPRSAQPEPSCWGGTDGSTGSGSLAASASSFCSLACLRLQETPLTPAGAGCWDLRAAVPAVLLVLCIQLVGLLGLFCHPARHQFLVVLRGFPQLLFQGGEGDLQGVVLVLQGLVGLLQVLQGQALVRPFACRQVRYPQPPVRVSA